MNAANSIAPLLQTVGQWFAQYFQATSAPTFIPEAARPALIPLVLPFVGEDTQILWRLNKLAEARLAYGRTLAWQHILEQLGLKTAPIGLLEPQHYHQLLRLKRKQIRLLIADTDTSAAAVPTEDEFRLLALSLSPQDHVDFNEFHRHLLAMGFHNVAMVTQPAEVARRGGIIDLYIPGENYPTRIEFWGDEVISIRAFDAHDQRSISPVVAITELSIPALVSPQFGGRLADYANHLYLLSEASQLDTFPADLQRAATAQLCWDRQNTTAEFSLLPNLQGRIFDFYQALNNYSGNDYQIVVISNQASRLQLAMQDHLTRVLAKPLEHLRANWSNIRFIDQRRDDYPIAGFELPRHKLAFFTDFEIFGFVKPVDVSVGALRHNYKSFLENIQPGDLVVHSDHGIGRFHTMTETLAAGIKREYLLVIYANDDKVYVPITQLHKLSKYMGKDPDFVELSTIGSLRWKQARKKAIEDSQQVARELLKLYAMRSANAGFAFPADDYLMQQLEASFPYMETPDQAAAIASVKQDMETIKPMDRLICGDVGFGKTEVAIRAMLKAASGGKQVAFLCPTTILADQHFDKVEARLSPLGLRIGLVSRFRKPKQNLQTISELTTGKLDIIVGTHRLLSADVEFRDLGLLIIDEEQRFGVSHKEKIKQLRHNVDVLALSATPIPRTLNLSLVGIRDVSLITTPPKGRRPIKTTVGPYLSGQLTTVIRQELARHGQTFIVYNKVKSIEAFAREIAALVPEARIATSHGQMDGAELEAKMNAFVHGKIDILVTSTIIENGVDIPNANTIVIIDADEYGLASLYQLRGRVGRSDVQAYSYFLTTKEQINPNARKRLEAIAKAEELGAGLSIAMRDLEIRGAGNILGSAQSGHVDGVGFELYSRILKKAIHNLQKGTEPTLDEVIASEEGCTVELPLSAFIPASYINADAEKMDVYQRLSEITSAHELELMTAELQDRFGRLPVEVINLLYLIGIRITASRLGIMNITIKDGILHFKLDKTNNAVRSRIALLPLPWFFEGREVKAYFAKLGNSWKERIASALSVLGS